MIVELQIPPSQPPPLAEEGQNSPPVYGRGQGRGELVVLLSS